jgi:hypothetical protein
VVNKIFYSLLCIEILISSVSGQIRSPFNNLPVTDSSLTYSFIVSGHFHGASNNTSTYPAATLLANIDTINKSQAAFLMCLGDMFLDVNEDYIKHYKKSLFDRLKIPLFNAVGNHDVSNGNLYSRIYGSTYYTFKIGKALFIVLDTEINDGSIRNEQLQMFIDVFNKNKIDNFKNVFVFSHRPIWAEHIPRYSKLFKENTRTLIGENNFETEIQPIIKKAAKSVNVFWISGSMGSGPSSFFYDKNEETNITYMQTAIRDTPRDAMLQVNIIDGKVFLSGFPLTGQVIEPIEKHNVSYWESNLVTPASFNFRLLPLYVKQMILHHFFWIGFGVAIILCLMFRVVIKKWQKRK